MTTVEPARRIGLRMLVMIPVFFVFLLAEAGLSSVAAGNAIAALVVGGATAVGGLMLYRFMVRRLERRSADEAGLRDLGPGVLRGAGLGVALFAVTIAIIAVLGGYRIAGWGSLPGTIATFGTMVGAAVAEELLFRGVLFRLLQEWAGTAVALVASGALFGGLHLLNPGATLWGAIAIACEAGVLLGAAYAATRSLWVPIGLHLGWNFAESGLFGTAVSGAGGEPHGLLRGVTEGPAAISGGSFGPEGSVVAILVGGVAAALFLRAARRRA
ncbi:lysostaphin resistance A-like protein [Dactylosporangium sp. CA-139066]|uniref:CPBP family intramembrane glutamic endopeptidase n=1 Tax=Dactylosporangium sp. CA-139066 TaxID=3239930 RepID=UPI003D8D728E